VILRGGAWKPRTSPYAFQGLGRPGLKLLAKAREETGLLICTEAMDPEGVGYVAEVAEGCTQGDIGHRARNLAPEKIAAQHHPLTPAGDDRAAFRTRQAFGAEVRVELRKHVARRNRGRVRSELARGRRGNPKRSEIGWW